MDFFNYGVTMTRFVLVVATLILSLAPVASAKRSAPKEVAQVVANGLEYRVVGGVERQGYVEAYDARTRALQWTRQIYVVLKDPNLEGDVQDVFISDMRVDGQALLIINEIGFEYRLDLESLEVKALKGAVAVRRHPH
jgi:hypothetical protein